MAPNWPSSLRSKITTDITLVAGVNRMIEADSSRMTPMKMKHQAAMIPLRASGAVTSRRTRSRPAPRMRPASSSSGGMAAERRVGLRVADRHLLGQVGDEQDPSVP